MEQNNFTSHFRESIENQEFVKLTFSKPLRKSNELQNVYLRLVTIKTAQKVTFTYRNKTNDIVKNYSLEEAISEIENLLKSSFKMATLFTIKADYLLQTYKNNKGTLKQLKATFTNLLPDTHDKNKFKRAEATDSYLRFLGIADKQGNIIPKMADKYRQINKYLETIESLIKNTSLPKEINVVDMGAGKGYLTFALYDYLQNKLNRKVNVLGIEVRQDLVDYCNKTASECGFENLSFQCQSINDFKPQKVDILIALHACDTATDDAIHKGIIADASLIICAPCCHKQLRQDSKGKEQSSPILKYGIFKERQFEMATDTIRALIMEQNQYQTKIFEFISNEHTRKNIMLVGSKISTKSEKQIIDEKIKFVKEEFGVGTHYLEQLM